MDPRERYAELQEAVSAAMDGRLSGLWTALPGIIESYDAGTQTVQVQPTIKGLVNKPGGSTIAVDLPLLLDVPVIFPNGGGVSLTFPIAKDDECLVVFSSRCIDGWWQSGGVQLAPELRLHDLSDGFAIVGPRSQPNKLGGVSTSTAQLRTDDAEAYIELDPSSHDVNVVTPSKLNAQTGGDTDLSAQGNVNITSAVAVNVTAPAINLGAQAQSLLSLVTSAFMSLFNEHTHPDSEGGNVGVPNQQMDSTHLTSTIKGG